jgi:hypothetical protein
MKHQQLTDIGACSDAIRWASRYDTLDDAWRKCKRGDWMLWYASRVGADHVMIVRAACACARLALPHLPDGEDRPRLAVETTEAWCAGRATLDEVRAAGAAAWAAARAAVAAAGAAARAAEAAAGAAAWAAARAAEYAAGVAAWAAEAADAARAAAWAAEAADAAGAAGAAESAALQHCADIVRGYFPTLPRKEER